MYKRILLKLSGEALSGQGTNFDPEILKSLASQIKEIQDLGVEIAIVVGGGNFIRGKMAEKMGIERVQADYMGMLATVINALAIQSSLEQIEVPTRVQTAIEMNKVAEPFIARRAIRHLEYFPVEINRADYDTLLRVPGIGYKSASRIVKARRHSTLDFADLKKIGVVLKRALYFITCSGRMMYRTKLEEDYICRNLMGDKTQIPREIRESGYQQLSLFDTGLSTEPLPLS